MTTNTGNASGAAEESQAPTTTRAAGASGPEMSTRGMTGEPPDTREDTKQGGAGTDQAQNPPSSTAGRAADTGPVVEGTGGGLQFERQASGSRARPTKEQPTTPERAEVVEGRRLEQEFNRSRRGPAMAAGRMAQVGDRVRVLRSAATGWELGTIRYLAEAGGGGSAELDGGEIVGLEAGRWEPFAGALLAPDNPGDASTFRQEANAASVPNRRSGQRGKAPEGQEERRGTAPPAMRETEAPESRTPRRAPRAEPKSKQQGAKPARARRQRTEAQREARRKAQKRSREAKRAKRSGAK